MIKEELFEHINKNTHKLEENFDVDSLDKLKGSVEELHNILPPEVEEARKQVGLLKAEIKECENKIENNQLVLRDYNSKISSMTSDISYCNTLLQKIKIQKEKAEFEAEVNRLIQLSQTFKEAFGERMYAYQELRATNAFIIDEKEVDLTPAFEVAETYMNPDNRFMSNQDWYSARKAYNSNIRELCELRVKGMAITLEKSKARFDVIDNLIAQYEEELFKNVED